MTAALALVLILLGGLVLLHLALFASLLVREVEIHRGLRPYGKPDVHIPKKSQDRPEKLEKVLKAIDEFTEGPPERRDDIPIW